MDGNYNLKFILNLDTAEALCVVKILGWFPDILLFSSLIFSLTSAKL